MTNNTAGGTNWLVSAMALGLYHDWTSCQLRSGEILAHTYSWFLGWFAPDYLWQTCRIFSTT